MDFRPGDIQWLLNYAALHSRTAYVDFPQPERKRHLLRLWLKRDVERPLVEPFGRPFNGVEPVNTIPDEERRFHITQICYPRLDWGL